jgi:hypothetical protein
VQQPATTSKAPHIWPHDCLSDVGRFGTRIQAAGTDALMCIKECEYVSTRISRRRSSGRCDTEAPLVPNDDDIQIVETLAATVRRAVVDQHNFKRAARIADDRTNRATDF